MATLNFDDVVNIGLKRIDVMTIIDVLEHDEDDHEALIDYLKEVLKNEQSS